MNNIDEVREKVFELGSAIKVPKSKLIVPDRKCDAARYHVEFQRIGPMKKRV